MKEASPLSNPSYYMTAPAWCGELAWQSASDAMVLSDAEGNVITANPAYFELYGYSPREVIGREFTIIFPEAERANSLKLYKQMFAADSIPPVVEATIQRKDGKIRTVESSAQFIFDEGSKVAVLSIIRDISARKSAEAELLSAHRELIEANEALRQANASQQDLLSIVAHDLRNPLGLIRNLADLLPAEAGGNAAITEIADQISATSKAMIGLIAELLEMAKLDAGKIKLNRENTDIAMLVKSIVASNQVIAARKQQQIFLMTGESCYAELDPVLTGRVVDNIIGNAIKFSPYEKEILVRIEQEEDSVKIIVADQGQGLTDADKQKIFGKFQRLSATPTGSEPSSGLGLYLVKRIVGLHGGTISADSKGPGQGTTFIIELPKKAESL